MLKDESYAYYYFREEVINRIATTKNAIKLLEAMDFDEKIITRAYDLGDRIKGL